MNSTKISTILFFLFLIENILAQEIPVKYNLNFSPGIDFYSSKNQFINNYTYIGYAPSLLIESKITKANNYILYLKFSGTSGKLTPLHINKSLYNYNYTMYTNFSFSLLYLKKTVTINNKANIYTGISYSPYYSLYNQHYSNILYSNSNGYRKFYYKTYLNLSPSISFEYNWKNGELELLTYYSFFNYASFSDDNYIKQLSDAKSSSITHFYVPKEYNQFYCVLNYTKEFHSSWCIHSSLHFQNKNILYQSDIRDQYFALYIGIQKQF